MARQKDDEQIDSQTGGGLTFCRGTTSILVLILVLAGALRLVKLEQSPPGLNQDEAANAWNAYCLLKTGKDQVGESWPVFDMRGLGGHRTTLHIYLLMPFQALGGLNIITTRLPAALGGILTVLLIYLVGRRLFDRATGLAAAALLAVNPWHIQQSRWGQDAALCALFGIIPLAAMLWANLPVSDDHRRPVRPFLAALAGALSGIVCYGYHAMRVFVPALLLTVVIVTLPQWWRLLKSVRGAIAIGAFVIAFAATFGPLAHKHFADPQGAAKRAESTWIWQDPDPVAEKAKAVLRRYASHFGPDFLFVRGDHYEIQSPPGVGQFHWYMLPLMLGGLAVVVRRFKSSYGARVVLALVLVYPIGDCFSSHISLHALRSLPGLCGLVLLAGVGGVSTFRWLRERDFFPAEAVTAVFLLVVIVLNVFYLQRFYGPYNQREAIYRGYHVDLVEACNWLRDRFDEADAVFFTTRGFNQPYIVTLVALGYDPQQWFDERRDRVTPGEFDIYPRYGRMHFMYGGSAAGALNELHKNNRPDRVIFIVRPGELGLQNPTHQIYGPDGQARLWIFQRQI